MRLLVLIDGSDSPVNFRNPAGRNSAVESNKFICMATPMEREGGDGTCM